MSLRWRIAIGLAVIAALVSTLGAAGAYLTTARQLEQSIDDSLLARATAVDRLDGRGPPPDVGPIAPGPCPPPGAVQPAAAAQLVASDGTVTPCIDGAPELPVDGSDRAIARDGGARRLRTVTVAGTRYRMLTVPWPAGGALQSARSLEETEAVLASLRVRLLVISLVATAAAALLGWFFARRLVRPIERLRDSAERIARTQDLDAPVPNEGGGEIGSLATSFSTMVDGLAASRRQQQQLITDASHELRTPLTSLRTNAELLDRAELLTTDERHGVARAIQLEVHELSDLVSELVELATDRTNDEQPEPLRLGELAREAARRAQRRSGRTITVVDDGGAVVLARPHMIERAIGNLVDNAIKYSPTETPVEIAITGRRLEVRDRGPGIAPADQPHVFDRFYRSPAARTEPGSGLGLAIVAQIVGRHDGTVWATSLTEGGAAVGFELPEAPAMTPRDDPPDPPRPSGGP